MASVNKTASTTISFQNESGPDGTGGSQISMGLDAAKNAEVYGENKTSFAPNEMAYLFILPHGDYQLQSSAGTVSKQGSNIPFEQSENLTFENSVSASLAHPPMGAVTSWRWLGNAGGTPLFTGRTVSVPAPVVGVLQVTYKTAGDRIGLVVTSLNGLDELPVLVVATNGDGDKANATVTFTLDGSDPPVPTPTEIEVTNFCSGDIVPGATVYIDGVDVGVTNAAGIVYAGMLIPGRTYVLKVTGSGFTDSDKDVLNNDSFTVPVSD